MAREIRKVPSMLSEENSTEAVKKKNHTLHRAHTWFSESQENV